MTQSTINWQKLGLVIKPRKDLWWMKTHAMIPTLQTLEDGHLKVYFSGRDEHNVSHIGYCVMDLDRPTEVLDFCSEPVLSPGARGCFDDNGVTPSCVREIDGRTFLYYIGWNPGFNVRMHLFGGLAIQESEGEPFERYSQAPILERCRVNPLLNTAPFVLPVDDHYLMYYVSGTEWIHKDLPRYHIQIARSDDGREWTRDGTVAIDFQDSNECALARPWVIREGDVYRMWFAHKSFDKRNDTYRLGYAESTDGINWVRDDASANLAPSELGWDSQMVEYAAVTRHRDQLVMFYNGNHYGQEGIGIAVQA